jgi:NadR type nicotinamide-nucleotide adenylyltransferase
MEKTLGQHSSNRIKICLFGPESSGKSTLSQKLSQHYKAPLVPEYARAYLQNLWDTKGFVCRPKDLLPIAKGQMQLENKAVRLGDKLIICDTDLLSTKVYSQAYYQNWCPTLLEEYALKNTYDLYLLTYIDTPWDKDDLRDKPQQREEMFTHFKNALERYGRPYLLLQGSLEERMRVAIQQINNLLS